MDRFEKQRQFSSLQEYIWNQNKAYCPKCHEQITHWQNRTRYCMTCKKGIDENEIIFG